MEQLIKIILDLLEQYKHADFVTAETRAIVAQELAEKLWKDGSLRSGRRTYDKLREKLLKP